ncbi:MAG: GNAT family N-acetyltransferase [Candidatus Eisenbacteria bacterium]
MSAVPGFTLSNDHARLPYNDIHRWLAGESYWAADIPFDTMKRAIEHSVPFAIYEDGSGALAAFGRVVTDQATFAYVGDVFVLPAWRGRGLSKWLMEAMAAHPDLTGLRRWILATRDGHGLYAKTGYTALEAPERWMERRPIKGDPAAGG